MLAVGGHLLGHLGPRAVAMSTGFAGGFGDSREEICGALGGGAMVIGALHGRSTAEEDDRSAIDLTSRFRERFISELGDARCGPLRERVQAPGGLGSCSAVVERAAIFLPILRRNSFSLGKACQFQIKPSILMSEKYSSTATVSISSSQ